MNYLRAWIKQCGSSRVLSSSAGTEPDAIREVMEALDPLVLGQTLTGAGGGGFLVLLTKEPNMADKVKAVIQEKKVRIRNFYYQ